MRRAVSICSTRGAAAPDGEEHVGVGVAAGRTRTPRVDVPVVRADPGQCHALPPVGDSSYVRIAASPGGPRGAVNPRLLTPGDRRKGLTRNSRGFRAVAWHGERDARARAPGRQPAGAREHGRGDGGGGRAGRRRRRARRAPHRRRRTWWSATTPRPPAGRSATLTLSRVADGPARGADAGRGARRLPGHAGERRGQGSRPPGRRRAGARSLDGTAGRAGRRRARVVVRPRDRRPGPRAAPDAARPASCRSASTRSPRSRPPSSTATPPSTPTCGRSSAIRRRGLVDRRPTTRAAGQRVDGQRRRPDAPRCATPGVDAVITDVPDLAARGAQGTTTVRQSGRYATSSWSTSPR